MVQRHNKEDKNDSITMESTPVLMDEGFQAFLNGNQRLAAKKYLQAFHAVPDRWHAGRWLVFFNYSDMMKRQTFPGNLEDDVASLKAIMEDKKELKLYRIEAAWTAGIVFNDRAMRRDEAADCFREAVRLAEKMSSKEKKHKVFATSESGVPDTKCMEELVSPIVDECKKILHRLAGHMWGEYGSLEEALRDKLRDKGIDFPGLDGSEPLKMNIFGEESCLTPDEVFRLRRVGGDECDCCGKSRQELGQKLLNFCARCRKAYYCSRDCQAKQWKAGHKQHCRKPGEFKSGDVLTLFGLQSRPDLNGTLIKIVGEDPNNKGRWKVKTSTFGDTISVASEKMRQLRPLK